MIRNLTTGLVVGFILAALPTAALAAPPAHARGGQAQVSAHFFQCNSVLAHSTKDLSNVVVSLADGSEVKFEGLRGNTWQGSFDQEVLGVWIKSGSNHSGAGPGYGQWVPSDADCGGGTGEEPPCDLLADPTCLDGGGVH